MEIIGPSIIYTFEYNSNQFILIGDKHDITIPSIIKENQYLESDFVMEMCKFMKMNCDIIIEVPFNGNTYNNPNLELIKLQNKLLTRPTLDKDKITIHNVDLNNSVFTSKMNKFKFAFMLARIYQFVDKFKAAFYKKIKVEFSKISRKKFDGDDDDYANIKSICSGKYYGGDLKVTDPRNNGLHVYRYFMNKYNINKFVEGLIDSPTLVPEPIAIQLTYSTNNLINKVMVNDKLNYLFAFIMLNDYLTIHKILNSKKNTIIIVGFLHAENIIKLLGTYIDNIKIYSIIDGVITVPF